MSDMIHFNDINLVHKFLIGDEEAGRELYENAYVPLLSFIRSRCAKCGFSPSDFEDIAADTMVRSVERLDRYSGTCTFQTFLFGISKNVIKEHLRKHRREIPTDFDALHDAQDEGCFELSASLSEYYILPEDYVIRKESIAQLTDALMELKKQKDEYFQIIQLRLFNEVPYETISMLSGESISALESRFRRAMKALKNILEK